jgi:hypothetical protein
MTPVCDPADFTCRPCRFHAECPGAACNLFSGECLTATPTMVGTNAGDLATAIAAAPAEAILIVQPGAGDYEGPFNVDGKTIAILAQGGRPVLSVPSASNSPTLTVNNNTTVLLQGLDVTLNGSAVGLQVAGNLALDQVTVRQNTGGGINATSTADIRARNTIIAGNGIDTPAIDLASGADFDLLYSSVGGVGTVMTTTTLDCGNSPNVTIRNSILFSQGIGATVVNCASATISHTAADEALTGDANTTFTVDMGLFTALSQGDLRLTAAGQTEFQNDALWRNGDPPDDIDGAARPTADMTQDIPGAHLGP